jgi:hypothetical protein
MQLISNYAEGRIETIESPRASLLAGRVGYFNNFGSHDLAEVVPGGLLQVAN